MLINFVKMPKKSRKTDMDPVNKYKNNFNLKILKI